MKVVGQVHEWDVVGKAVSAERTVARHEAKCFQYVSLYLTPFLLFLPPVVVFRISFPTPVEDRFLKLQLI